MEYNKQHSKHKKRIFLAVFFGVTLLVTIAVIFILRGSPPDSLETAKDSGEPSFSFDSTRAQGWWSAGNRAPATNAIDGPEMDTSELPIADISVHEEKTDTATSSGCFVSFSYYAVSIDPAATLQAKAAQITEGRSGIVVNAVGVQDAQIVTPEGVKAYKVHQYALEGSPSQNILRGAQFAYVPIQSGHIQVFGYCKKASDLAKTTPVLSAVSLSK